LKRILFALALWALAFPGLQKAEARTDVSIDFFYDNLNDGGNWIEVRDYGYCWQPSVAVSNSNWRPYADGYWAYTDVGWTWISYEDFGWATYHYGRWIRLRGRGWAWVPGREWGPAWVSWRTGGDYVGWAPLPPRRAGEYWDEQPITARVDIDFDIGPAYYNFIDVRYIGEPVLRERIFAPEQNVACVARTVNVTNITYNNSAVYNYGPDYNTVSRYSTRPIQRLSLQRETNVDLAAARQSKSLMKVQGDKLVVAAPQQFQKPTKPVAPKVVKEKIAQAPIERGWGPVTDPKAQAELKEKMKKEDPKAVPPPTVPVSDTTATSPATVPGKNENREIEKVAPPISPSASMPTIAPTPTHDRSKNKERNKVTPKASVPPDKRRYEMVVPPQAVPRIVAPPTPEVHNKALLPDAKPESVEKPRHQAPTDIAPKTDAPANPPPRSRDEGNRQKKNEAAVSPTP
jgi:hypothetical protein